jgi:Family of unknown function (DUF6491)
MQSDRFGLLAIVLLLLSAGMAAAQDDDQDEEGERDMDSVQCVRISDIEGIDVVDSRTLVFRMRGDDVYENKLPFECPGLKRNDTLMYRASVGQLCNIDIVTVLEDWGFGFAPGPSCGLGMFNPITEEIADELMRQEQ